MIDRTRTVKRVCWTIAVGLCVALGARATANEQAFRKPTAAELDAMVLVPSGKFVFGKDFKKSEVELPAFLIDKHEVTNRQFAKFNLDHKFEPIDADLPATMVSQIDARNHCEALDKRLPTEQEWEKAARGTDGRAYPWGNEFDPEAAVTSETEFGAHPPHPLIVGSRAKGKSPYGALDMAGNVWEWTNSNEGRYFVLRGGSFFEDRSYATVTSRLLSIPNDSKDYVGFRCAKSAK